MNFSEVMISLCEGFGITCLIFILTLVLSLPLGLIITFGSMSKIKPLRYVTRTFVWIIRGTPLLLQIIIIFYGPGLWFDVSLKNFRFTAVIIAFVINYACYFSEIYRGGIESIPKGQYEGCYVLGMSKSQTFFKVILPQVIKRILPSISNEVITLVKDTSLARVIAVVELVQIAEKDVFGIDTYYDMEYKTEKVIAHNTLNPDDENLYYAYKVSIIDKNNLETAVDVIIDENSGKILQKSSIVYYSTSIIKMSDVKCQFTANPVKNKLYLTLPQVENEIKIFNIQGKLMLRQVVGQTAIINVQCLKSGTYVLIVNNTEKQKIVIN